jgi:hypothetical protein
MAMWSEWRRRDYQKRHCTGDHQEEGDLYMSGRGILSPLWKIEVWNMES